MRALLALLLAAVTAGCATTPEKLDRVALAEEAHSDYLENLNRKLYRFNREADRVALKPVVQGYRRAIPVAAQRGISGYYGNVREMLNLPNALAQGKVKSAFRAADRLLINGILGLGLADHASDMGLYTERHDFGQTLAVWGVSSGPFVMIPFLGPSTLRDGVGQLVDFLYDPASFILDTFMTTPAHVAEIGVQFIDMRSRFMDTGEQILTGSADEYATVRSAWLQLRRYELFDGMPPPEADDLDDPDDPDDDDGGADDGDANGADQNAANPPAEAAPAPANADAEEGGEE